MTDVSLEFSKPLTSEERDAICHACAPIFVVARDATGLSFVPPPQLRVERGIGLQHSLGIDPATILVVSVASGVSIFMTKLTQEIAVDFWKGIKKLLAERSKRHKAIGVNSAQLQMGSESGSRFTLIVVTTWLNARFLNEEAVAELACVWHEQLSAKIEQATGQIPPNIGSEGRTRTGVVLHAVINGSTAPEWHIEVADEDAAAREP
jgi:ribosomal protein L18E